MFVGLHTGRANGRPDIERLGFSKPMRYSAFNKKHWARAVAAAGLPVVSSMTLGMRMHPCWWTASDSRERSRSRRFRSDWVTPPL